MTQVKLALLDDAEISLPKGRVTPAATHLFALTLLVTLEPLRQWPRPDLQQLLFEGAEKRLAAHSLRQLLYRLRQLGLEFDERASGLRLKDPSIEGPVEQLRAMVATVRAGLPAEQLRVLPSYSPPLSRSFLEWLDDIRDLLNARIRQLLNDDLKTFRDSHDWESTLKISNALSVIDPLNGEIVSVRAEALALVGRKTEALHTLDRHARQTDDDHDANAQNARLRARIVKLAPLKRLSTLRGREKCLAFLEKEWTSVDDKGARMSVVIGQAGMGKTRVADEFSSRSTISRGHVLRFACDSQMRSHPLALFYHLLPQLRAMRGSLGASPEYKSALSRVRPLAGAAEPEIGGDDSAKALRAEIQLAIIDILEAVTSERPCLLVVDDAHHLDDASASVLRALAMGENSAMLQIVACMRPTHVESALLLSSHRGAIHSLDPLDDVESRRLILELQRDTPFEEEHVAWCLREAAGNPFYLQTLALHEGVAETLPNSIQSLARGLYSALSVDSRTVLEVSLLLGRFASLSRVQQAAEVRDGAMLVALRELEDNGLVQFREGLLVGPHMLLVDSLVSFIPSAVGAMLRQRIAALLIGEYGADEIPPGVAWVAAQHLISAGEPATATRLIQRCARNAAALGEAGAATELLTQALSAQLPVALRAILLDDQVIYARSGGLVTTVCSALQSRLRVAKDLGEASHRIKELQFQIVEADVASGAPISQTTGPLTDILADEAADSSLRIRAAVRLLVFADNELDPALADKIIEWVERLATLLPHNDANVLRARVVFHTVFGQPKVATEIARQLIQAYPHPHSSETARKARNFAAFAFHRLRESALAAPICEADFAFMLAGGVLNEALYAASLRTDIAIADGDFESADTWFSNCEIAARGVSPHSLSPNAGFYANAGVLAMRQGRYDEAQAFFLAPQSILLCARYRAVSLALIVRLRQLRGDMPSDSSDEDELYSLYLRGRARGEQDTIVEALWVSHVLREDPEGASRILLEYLTEYRRERAAPEWFLRTTTASDPAWIKFESAQPR